MNRLLMLMMVCAFLATGCSSTSEGTPRPMTHEDRWDNRSPRGM